MANWVTSFPHHPGYDGPDIELFGNRDAGTLAIVLPARPESQDKARDALIESSDRSMLVAVIPHNYSPRSQLQSMGLATEHLTTPRAEALTSAHLVKQTYQGTRLVGLIDADPASTLIRDEGSLWEPGQGNRWDGFATASAMPLGEVAVANDLTDVSPLTYTEPLAKRWENARNHQFRYYVNANDAGELAGQEQQRCRRLLDEIDELTRTRPLRRGNRARIYQLGQELARRHDGSIIYREAISGLVNIASSGADETGKMALLIGLGFANTAKHVFVLNPTQRATAAEDAVYRVRLEQQPGYTAAYDSNSSLALSALRAMSRPDDALMRHLPLPVTAAERTHEIVAADPNARTAAFVGYGSPEGVAACLVDAAAEPLGPPPHFILPLELDPTRGRALRAALMKQGVGSDRISLATSNRLVRGLATVAGAGRPSATNLSEVWPAATRLRRRAQAL